MILEQVISGGQIGADIAALKAAKQFGIKTGGWAPKDFRTRDGNNPALGTVYGLNEHHSILYPPRTDANVVMADGTIRFAHDFNSPGERCTFKALARWQQPFIDIELRGNSLTGWHCSDARAFWWAANWIVDNNIKILNVAGNADPSIESFVEEYLTDMFEHLNKIS